MITFGRFDMGLDTRKGASVSDANRLLVMRNAYVSPGLAAVKRPGFECVETLPTPTAGLFAARGHLHTFTQYSINALHESDTPQQALKNIRIHRVPHHSSPTVAVRAVLDAVVFYGQIYAVIEYSDGSVMHHIVNPDGSPQGAGPVVGGERVRNPNPPITFVPPPVPLFQPKPVLVIIEEPERTDFLKKHYLMRLQEELSADRISQLQYNLGEIQSRSGISSITIKEELVVEAKEALKKEEKRRTDEILKQLLKEHNERHNKQVEESRQQWERDNYDLLHLPPKASACPHGRSIVAAQGKIFSTADDVVRYSKTGDARDWGAADDAGFLPTGRHSAGDTRIYALAIHNGDLLCFSSDHIQIWAIDADPKNMRLKHIMGNIGCKYPASVVHVANDIFFLSDAGFRSIGMQQNSDNRAENDIGSPIDSLVVQMLRNHHNIRPVAAYFPELGQYICALGNTLFVYTFSRSNRIAAWSTWDFPEAVDYFSLLNNRLYIRAQNQLWAINTTASADSDSPITCELQLPWMDCKSPTQLKMLTGLDAIVEGQCEFSISTDANAPQDFSAPIVIQGNTRGRALIPLHGAGTEFGVRITHSGSEPFRLDNITLHYELLGPV